MDLAEQLTKHLTDVHAIEVQALEQMRIAPRMAGDAQLHGVYAQHFTETAGHERLVRGELEQRGESPSLAKDVAGRVGGWGMVLFARFNPDTPGKLAMHAYSYEHMELAAYELLWRVADRAGDDRIRGLAERIGGQERGMADRIAARWDQAVEASTAATEEDLVKYLRDAHALEAQALQLLETPVFPELEAVFGEHLEQTREQQRLVEERLRALGSKPGRFQPAALRVGGLNLAAFFGAQPDTPVKIAGFAYAFEALEVGAYELLARTARRAGDGETAELAERIRGEEQAAAERIARTWDAAVDAALVA